MQDVAALTPEQARMLLEDYYQRRQQGRPRPAPTVYPAAVFEYAVLQGNLAAAGNAHDTPGTSTATLLVCDADDNFVLSTITVDVINLFESIALAEDTLVVIVQIRGKWQVVAADCEPLDAGTLTDLTPTPEEEPP